MNDRADVLGGIASAVRDLIDRGGPAGVREPRRPKPSAPPGWHSEETPGEAEHFADPLGLSEHPITGYVEVRVR